jgi:hypothetical protein
MESATDIASGSRAEICPRLKDKTDYNSVKLRDRN